MDSDSYIDQQVTSGCLKGIIFNILSEEDAGKISTMVVGTVHEVSDPALGVPNRHNSECLTCGSKLAKECEGHFGLINFPFTILNPYFMSEIAQILNKICPGCKFFRHDKVKVRKMILHRVINNQTNANIVLKPQKECIQKWYLKYPPRMCLQKLQLLPK